MQPWFAAQSCGKCTGSCLLKCDVVYGEKVKSCIHEEFWNMECSMRCLFVWNPFLSVYFNIIPFSRHLYFRDPHREASIHCILISWFHIGNNCMRFSNWSLIVAMESVATIQLLSDDEGVCAHEETVAIGNVSHSCGSTEGETHTEATRSTVQLFGEANALIGEAVAAEEEAAWQGQSVLL